MSKTYKALFGYTGQDPKIQNTSKGDIVKITLAQRTGYGDADVEWYDVAVWNEGLKQRVLKEVPKGSLIALEGYSDVHEYQGKSYNQINADRIGLVEAFQATKKAAVAATVESGYSDDV